MSAEERYAELQGFLKELFQLSEWDALDFGIYRILHARREEILRFLEHDLREEVTNAFGSHQGTLLEAKQQERDRIALVLRNIGRNPDQDEEIQQLDAEIQRLQNTSAPSAGTLEADTYSHLVKFFRRYYHEGDFISQRRYKDGTYAIPYAGEDVKLHWANHDQYYIKTSELLQDYNFRPSSDKRVHFRLVTADTDRDNNRAAPDQKRWFTLAGDNPIAEEAGELVIHFNYGPVDNAEAGGSVKQDALNKQAEEAILAKVPAKWRELLAKIPEAKAKAKPSGEKNGNGAAPRTVLRKHLTKYTARHTFDYFIHKDLRTFLRRELDFYIKSDVMHLDDLESQLHEQFVSYGALIRALRAMGHKLIDFMAQVEDFQKKLWLKKKFVVETNYCITLDQVPQELYAEIAANKAQREEWQRLFAIDEIEGDPASAEFLQANDKLVLDTKFFDEAFKLRLLASIDNLDERCDGLLVHSENFQALNLLQERYRGGVKCIYIDPPYNTAASEILYKNSYFHSSWLSLIHDRLALGRELLSGEGFNAITIDYMELFNLGKVADLVYGDDSRVGIVTIYINPKGRQHERFFSSSTEYMLVYAKDEGQGSFQQTTIDSAKTASFDRTDGAGKYRLDPFARIRSSTKRSQKGSFYYPIYVSPDLSELTLEEKSGYHAVYPVDGNGEEYSWKVMPATFEKNNLQGEYVAVEEEGRILICNKYYEQQVYKNLWQEKKYFPEFNGTNLLKAMFGQGAFTYPKSVHAVEDWIKISSGARDTVLDYFAGSGTTGHAVINLNREDGGGRKYILVEMGEYFDGVLKPRMAKAAYASSWKDGKPQARSKGVSHCFKYIRLESYEDTLNNLEANEQASEQRDLLQRDGFSDVRQEYMLRYLLDWDTQGSKSLLNLAAMEDPFAYQLKVSDGSAGNLRPANIDLVETFNHLLGLRVQTIRDVQGVRVVTGLDPRGKSVLVLWRRVADLDNDGLRKWFEGQGYPARAKEYSAVYVNGANTLQALLPDSCAVHQLEDAFFQRMFDIQSL